MDFKVTSDSHEFMPQDPPQSGGNRHVKAAGGRVIEVLTHLPLVAQAFWVYIQDIDIPKRGHLLRDYEPVP